MLDVLRNHLDLKGSRYGCGLEQCGSCMVLVDGEAGILLARAKSAQSPARRIETIEGLGWHASVAPGVPGGTGGPVRLLPVRHHHVSAKALLDRNPAPTRADIVTALDGHLCRCGAHPRIIARRRKSRRRSAPKGIGSGIGGGISYGISRSISMSDTLAAEHRQQPPDGKMAAVPTRPHVRLAVGKVEIGQGDAHRADADRRRGTRCRDRPLHRRVRRYARCAR